MSYCVMVNGEPHGEVIEGSDAAAQLAALEAAADVIDPPAALRKVFMYQLASGKYADDGERRVWVEEVDA